MEGVRFHVKDSIFIPSSRFDSRVHLSYNRLNAPVAEFPNRLLNPADVASACFQSFWETIEQDESEYRYNYTFF